MFALICTDGQMSVSEIHAECVKEKWVPLLVYRSKDSKQPILPTFTLLDTARAFSKRNLPKEWLKGTVWLTDVDIQNIEKRGWRMEPFEYPRKMKDLPDIEFGFEIHEFAEEPVFKTGRL